MSKEVRRSYDAQFREGAVRTVLESGKSIAAIARDLGINEGTLGSWVARAKAEQEGTEGLSRSDAEELK
jgi:transposase